MADVDIIVMQTAVNFNADSEWDGVAQTIKKSLDEVKKELKKELNDKFEDSKNEMAEIKAMLIKINEKP